MNSTFVWGGREPFGNLALEQYFCNGIKEGEVLLYLWQNANTVVVGRNQNAWKECRCELLEQEGGVLARRSSGGGAVYHDLGNLNFTFVADVKRYDLKRQLGVIVDALKDLGIDAQFSGRNDITVLGRKFSGNAFRHTKGYSMQHGTLLVEADLEKLTRYLAPPKEKLIAKGVESVRSRVCNLREFNDDLTILLLQEKLLEHFEHNYGHTKSKSNLEFDTKEIEQLKMQNSSWEWNYGLTPRFELALSKKFDWGMVELCLGLKNGIIENVKLFTDSMDETLSARLEKALLGVRYDDTASVLLCYKDDVQFNDIVSLL